MRYLRSSERPFSEQWRIAEAPGMLVQSSRIEEEEEGKIEIVSSAWLLQTFEDKHGDSDIELREF